MIAVVAAACRAYAEHAGLPEPPGGFRAQAALRLARWPVWARLGAGLAAVALLWLAPAALAGRCRRFGTLSAEDKENVLARLQQARSPLARGAFLMLKTLVLGTCYGPRIP